MRKSFGAALLGIAVMGLDLAPGISCEIGNCAYAQNAGVREYSAIGVRKQGQELRQRKGWFEKEWNDSMAKLVSGSTSCAFDDHYPTIALAFRWDEAYVNPNIKPTRSQARNPNWSNYIWNAKDKDSRYVADGISDALNSKYIQNGNGIAKLSIKVGLTATGTRLAPPAWMRKDKSLTWNEGLDANHSTENWHVRFDNPKAVDHAADFMAAVLAKYGKNKGLHSVVLNEYFLGQKKYYPKGLSRQAYMLGAKSLWQKVVASAPKDSSGKRVNIIQTHPIMEFGIGYSTLESIGIGITESDTVLEFPIEHGSLTYHMANLKKRGKVHVMINGDARFAASSCRASGRTYPQSWDGTPNPFGHKKGYRATATPQEILWYHSSKGPAPVDSIFLTMDDNCGPQHIANYRKALQMFGSCGTHAAKWGVVPASSGKNGGSNKYPPLSPVFKVE